MQSYTANLKEHGLRDTQPRRLVIDALSHLDKPVSPQEIHQWILARRHTVNLVTIYRALETLENIMLIHRHPCDGNYSLCSLPDTKGHHGFLHCHACGQVEEFVNAELCRMEDSIAASAQFQPHDHVTEIMGTCKSCS